MASEFGGSETSLKKRNQKFRTLNGDGKPLGDRELLLRKKMANPEEDVEEDPDEYGLFDRFSTARKTLNRGKKKDADEDCKSLNDMSLAQDKRSSSLGDWKSRLANKFKKTGTSDQYDLAESGIVNNGQQSYRKTSDELSLLSAPMTEPVRRRNPMATSDSAGATGGPTRSGSIRGSASQKVNRPKPSDLNGGRRRVRGGDYDSELVDGKYITSVPIISVEAEEMDEGNLRPSHRKDQGPASKGLRDLKKPLTRKNSLIERLSRSSAPRDTAATDSSSTRRATSGNVFDRLATKESNNLNGSRRSLAALQDEKKASPLSRIKDLTKTLRKSSREEDEHLGDENRNTIRVTSSSRGKSAVAPRDSRKLFHESSPNRKPMTNLSANDSASRNSISSSTRSLHQQRSASPRVTNRSSLATTGKNEMQ